MNPEVRAIRSILIKRKIDVDRDIWFKLGPYVVLCHTKLQGFGFRLLFPFYGDKIREHDCYDIRKMHLVKPGPQLIEHKRTP